MTARFRQFALLAPFALLPCLADEAAPTAPPTVVAVSVPGTALAVKLSTQVGRPFDPAAATRDLHYLWSLGRFQDVRVETTPRDGGIAVTFRAPVTPHLMLREVRLVPNTYGLVIHEPPETPIDPLRAHRIALDATHQLREGGYQQARVDYLLKPEPDGYADLKLKVNIGPYIRVSKVRFEGDQRLRGRLDALRIHRIVPGIPHLWAGWRLLPPYSPEAVDADAARIRALYVARGFFDADVHPLETQINGKHATVTLFSNPGPRYAIDPKFCTTLLSERREAERDGVLEFTATLDAAHPDDRPAVSLGPPYHVGRIDFRGIHRYRESTIRRNLQIDEGALLDEHALRLSIARLNRANLFETVSAKQVVVEPHEKTGLADVTFHLTERKRGTWRLSGPVGPLSLAGPVEAMIAMRLPPWGRGLLDLSAYTLSAGMFAFGKPLIPILNAPKAFTPIFFISRPFTPGEGWTSGLSYAPRLGWTDALLGYAGTQLRERLLPPLAGERGIVPDLKVTVTRPQGDTMMFCEAPGPRLGLLRTAIGIPVRLLGAFPF